jgi:phosphatidylglycerol---prolipoprotein diacylglyceryl transferase
VIPYLPPPSLELGPFTLEPFGLFAAAGVLLAAWLVGRQARNDGLDDDILRDLAPWAIGAGVVLGHWVHLFLYHPEELEKGPLQILKFWDGLSSMGGLLGGLLAALLYFRYRKVPVGPYTDAFALGMAPGWGVARIGCFAVHDHPGVRTDFFLAVDFPGGPRHDLGLYEALLLFTLAALLFALRRFGALRGRLIGVLALLYGAVRFGLDFLRATDLSYVDARYLGLTPAQYASVFLVAFGLYRIAVRPRWLDQPPPPGPASAPPEVPAA